MKKHLQPITVAKASTNTGGNGLGTIAWLLSIVAFAKRW